MSEDTRAIRRLLTTLEGCLYVSVGVALIVTSWRRTPAAPDPGSPFAGDELTVDDEPPAAPAG